MLQESLHGGHDEQLKKTLEVRDKLRLYRTSSYGVDRHSSDRHLPRSPKSDESGLTLAI